MKAITLALGVLAFLATSGCDKFEEELQKLVDTSIDSKLEALEKRLQPIEEEQKSFTAQLFLAKLEIENLKSSSVTLSPGETGYGILQTGLGPFIASFHDAKPYLDGYKVYVDIGNVTSAQFNGAKLKVNWYPDRAENMTWAEWHEKMRNKEFNITKKFRSGGYTRVELTLTPAAANEIKNIEIELEFDEIQLSAAQ